MSSRWIRQLCEEVKMSILKDDTPLSLIDEELYNEYCDMRITKKGVDMQYWLENILAKHESLKLQTFGKVNSDTKHDDSKICL